MMRKLTLIVLIWGIIFLITPTHTKPSPVFGQENAQALTHYALTIYSRPDSSSPIIGMLIPQAKVILEARNADTSWVLGRSTDGMVRGWMESRFLDVAAENKISALLFSNEIMFVPPTTDLTTVYNTINLSDYPIIPIAMGQAQTIFQLGQRYNRDPYVVSKIGDCISDNQHFLSPFGLNQYTLGNYTNLEPVVTYFRESLALNSLAAYDGLVTNAVLDSVFANPLSCFPGESPLRCEFRVHQPAIAVIMFGAQDLLFTSPEDFNRNLRQIVHETLQAGVVPILSTFPGNLERWDQSIRYNQIVVQIALDYDIPLMNFWRALYDLPNHGLNEDGRHLSLPVTRSGDLTPENLQRGYPMRNLITLQTLDAVWRSSTG